MRRSKLTAQFLRFLRDSKGATAIEYALIAAGVSVAIIGGVTRSDRPSIWYFIRS